MFLTVHATAGIAVAATITDHPISAFFIGFASHFLIDMIPHGDEVLAKIPKTQHEKVLFFFKIAVVDSMFGLLLFFLLLLYSPRVSFFALLAAAFGATLPDVLQGLSEVTENAVLKIFKRIHHFFHFLIPVSVSFQKGFIVQILLFLVLISLFPRILNF